MVRAIGARDEFVGPDGGLQPPGLVVSMVSAMLPRAPVSARLTWCQSSDWPRVYRMLRGLRPTPPVDKSPDEAVAGYEKIANPEAFDELYGHLPVQPGDKARVRSCTFLRSAVRFGRRLRGNPVTARPRFLLTRKVRTPVCGR